MAMKSREVWESELKDEVIISLMDFFTALFHTIMHRSGEYSPESFVTSYKLDVTVKMSSNIGVIKYIQDASTKLVSLLLTNELECVEMHLLDCKTVRERYVLDFSGALMIDSIFEMNDDQISAHTRSQEMKLILKSALTALVKLPKPLKPRRFSLTEMYHQFRIRLGVTEESFNNKEGAPFQDEDSSYLYPWKRSCHHNGHEYVEDRPSTFAISIDDTGTGPPQTPQTSSGQMSEPMNQVEDEQDRLKNDINELKSTDPSSPEIFEELEETEISLEKMDPLKSEDAALKVDSDADVPALTPIDSFVYFDTLVVNLYRLVYQKKILKDQDKIRKRILGFGTRDLNSPKNYRTSSKSEASPKTPTSQKKSPEKEYENTPTSSIRPDRSDSNQSPNHQRPTFSSSRTRRQSLRSAPVSPSRHTHSTSTESGHSPTPPRNFSSVRRRMTAKRKL